MSEDVAPEESGGSSAPEEDSSIQGEEKVIETGLPGRKGFQAMPMVGLGGSAGSIQALLSFFHSMPPDSGMAFVVILHLSPEHDSTLPALIQRVTSMPTIQVLESVRVKPNCVYVIPPGKALASADGKLRVADLPAERGRRVAVDLFFRTLADTHGPNSAAIVLSGADSDGALGIKRIKECEELETSREELQSINEELTTVNQELKSKLDELSHANSDLHNLMVSTAIPTVFLDRELRIMRYTPSAVDIFSLIPTDIGRPLSDLKHRLRYPGLEEDARGVLVRLLPVEREVSDDTAGRWYFTRLLPYRTIEDRVAGVVLTLIDITESKRTAVASKQAEVALRESESRFRALVSQAKAGITETDLNRRFTYVNDRFCEITGRTREELLEKFVHEISHAKDFSRDQPMFDRMISTGEPFDIESRLIRPDGTGVWVLKSVAPIFDASSRIIGVSSIVVDIEARKKAEIDLKDSEERNRIALEAAKMAAWDYDVQAGQGIWNERHYRILGIEPEGKLKTAEDFLGFIHPEDRPGIHAKLREAVEESGVFEAEFRIVRADNQQVRWMNGFGRAVEREAGKVARMSGVMFDITDRKRAEEGVRESEKRLSAIFTQAAAGLCEISLEGRFCRVNDALCRTLGRSRETLLSLALGDVVHPEDLPRISEALRGLAADGNPVSLDKRFLRPEGSVLWAVSSFTRLEEPGGKPQCILAVIVDLTERKRAMEELEQSRGELWDALLENERVRGELEAAGKAKDHFLAILSHELRTPLTPVLMATRILERRKDLLPEVRESLEMIRRNVQIEAQFIDDLLDVTRIERGKLEILREPVDLHQVLQQAIAIAEGEMHEKRQKLAVELLAEKCEVAGDATRLQQVMWNLLKNASKFSPEESEIRVETWNAGKSVLVSFSDQGIGIEPDAIHLIFDPFHQENLEVARKFGGLGLGLAIANATVQAHGGTLSAESPGRDAGATFIMSLPLAL